MRKQKLSKEEIAMFKRIGARIRQYRIKNKLTYEELAYVAGVARSTLREVEAGKSNVRVGNLRNIALAMGCGSLAQFLREVFG